MIMVPAPSLRLSFSCVALLDYRSCLCRQAAKASLVPSYCYSANEDISLSGLSFRPNSYREKRRISLEITTKTLRNAKSCNTSCLCVFVAIAGVARYCSHNLTVILTVHSSLAFISVQINSVLPVT